MDIVKILGGVIQKWGIVAGFHTLLFSGILIVLARKTEKGKNIWERVKWLWSGEKPTHSLKAHIMFANLKKYIHYDIQHFTLGDKLREAIFRDFLLIKFTVIQKQFETFVDRGDVNLMSNDLFLERMNESITTIIKSYENKARENEIPEIVIKKFNEWHENKIQAIFEFITTVCEDTDIYEDNHTKTRVIFDFINHINNFTILDAKKTLIHLNGELNKVVYKGISYTDKK